MRRSGALAPLLLAALLSACSVRGPEVKVRNLSQSPTTQASPGQGQVGAGGRPTARPVATSASPAVRTTGAARESKGQAAQPTGGPAAAIAPADAAPAPDGKYFYDSDTDGKKSRVTFTVETLSRSGAQVTQRVSLSGEAALSEKGVWSPGQQLVTELAFGSSDARASCSWSPPIEQFAFPLALGKSWSSTSDCEMSIGGTPAHAHEVMQAEVQRQDVVTVDGHPVGVWVVSRHDLMTISNTNGSYTRDSKQTEWYAPQVNQAPRIESSLTTTTSYGGKTSTQSSTTTSTMESLKPA